MSEALQQEIRQLRTLEGSARDPRDRIFLPLADAHLRLGHLDRARELLEDGLTRHPDFACGHVLMARLLENEGDLLQAEERWATARRLDPQNAEVLLALGRILVGRGEGLGGQLVLQARAMDPTAGGQEPDADLVEISDLAPEFPAGTPVVSIADLAPDAEPDVVSVHDLAPDAETGEPGTREPDALQPDVVVHADIDDSDVDVVLTEVDDADVAHAEVDPTESGDSRSVDDAAAGAGARPDRRVVTRTLAELFAGQGQRERAIEMYEELVARRPEDETLGARLAELRSGDVDLTPADTAREDSSVREISSQEPPSQEPPAQETPSHETPAQEVPAEADVADEEEFDPRLSPAAPEPEVSTPFAWTSSGENEDEAPGRAEDSEDPGREPPVSEYLGGLLGYTADRSPDDPSES